MRVSYVLLLTPFILACGRLPENSERRGFRKGVVRTKASRPNSDYHSWGVKLVKHEVKMRTTKACGRVNGQMARKFMADGYTYTWEDA